MPPLGFFPESHSCSNKGHATWHCDRMAFNSLTRPLPSTNSEGTRELMTRFGPVYGSAGNNGVTAAFPRKTLRQSNAITNYREVKGYGKFRTAVRCNLEPSLCPKYSGPHMMRAAAQGQRNVLIASDKDINRFSQHATYHHPPPAVNNQQSTLEFKVSKISQQAPYLWKPKDPDSVTYGFHRRWWWNDYHRANIKLNWSILAVDIQAPHPHEARGPPSCRPALELSRVTLFAVSITKKTQSSASLI